MGELANRPSNEELKKSIKPYLLYWEKAGVTAEQRRQDSASCGGGNSDSPGPGRPNVKAARLPAEKEHETYARLFHDWERCMLKNGYHFIGKCHDNEISRSKPACGAP